MAYEELDADLVRSHLTQHSSGLWVLPAPSGADLGGTDGQIDVTFAANLVSILRSEYRFAIFDVPPLSSNASGYLFSRCNSVVVITYLLDLAAIRDTGTLVEGLIQTRMPGERIKLVVNRRSQRNPFSIADLQQTVNHPIDAQVPEDGTTVTTALNEGIPVVLKSPGSPVAKAIKKLCNSLIADLPEQARTTSHAAAQSARDAGPKGKPVATVT
jgi:pilus assembly protein CpaE